MWTPIWEAKKVSLASSELRPPSTSCSQPAPSPHYLAWTPALAKQAKPTWRRVTTSVLLPGNPHPGRLWTDSRPDLGTTFIPDWQRFHRYQKRPVLWLEISILKLSLRPPAASTQLSHLASSLLMEIIFVSSEVLQTKIHLLTILSFVKWMIICCAKMSNWATWHPFCRCAVATAERV